MPTTIGGYELREKIHRSSSGSLYRAFNPLLGRAALVKTQPREAASSDEVLKRFQREIRLAAQLDHPNLFSALHAGVENGVHYLVLEDVQGVDLYAKVQQDGPLPIPQAVDYIRQAAEALGFLHEQSVIHRNIKPSNLMVDGQGVVRIANLTTALVGSDSDLDSGEEDLTRQGQVLGSAEYLAPEQAFDSHSADGRSDIYSLGCTLHYLLTGKPPYPASGGHRSAAGHIKQPIPSLQAARSEVSPALDAVFQMMLAKMAPDRYQTMAAVSTDLERALRGLAPQQAAIIHPARPWRTIAAIAGGIALGGAAMWFLQRAWN